MGYLSGVTGYAKLGSTSYPADKWKIAIKTGSPKVTNFTTSGYQTLVAGFIGATITLSGPMNSGSTAITAATSYAVHVGMDTGVELTCTAYCTGIDVDNSVEDAPRWSATFESSGSFTAAIA